VSIFKKLWEKFSASKRYREEFVAAQVKRGIPLQLRFLMKKAALSQAELARRSGLTQGVVSRAADPEYGNLTVNTLVRIAAGLDMAFVGKWVPFSELGKWFIDLSEESMAVKPFTVEDKELCERWAEEENNSKSVFDRAEAFQQELATDKRRPFLVERGSGRAPDESDAQPLSTQSYIELVARLKEWASGAPKPIRRSIDIRSAPPYNLNPPTEITAAMALAPVDDHLGASHQAPPAEKIPA
jgi:transcriptional regulator with XRE-family HTH domain